MKIIKILNNNTLIVDVNSREFVVIGKGIGFSKKIGDNVDEKLIEKKFSSYDIPIKYYELVKNIVDTYEYKMNIKLNNSIYVSLADHIYNAIKRHNNGEDLKNTLLNEIKVIYKEEFLYSLDAISYIYKETGILLSEDEIGFITMHFINGSSTNKKEHNIMIHVNNIEKIIKNKFNVEPFINFPLYSRLITHLKYLIIQKYDGLKFQENTDDIYDLLSKKYPNYFDVIDNINIYIKENFKIGLSKSEYLYLLIYIKNFLEVKNEKNIKN